MRTISCREFRSIDQDNFIDYSRREGRRWQKVSRDCVRAWRELRMEQRKSLRRQRPGELRRRRRRHHQLQTRHPG